MAEILEWFQCKSCGRRYRWNADIAGTEVRCQCGASILVPELESYAKAGPATTAEQTGSQTMIETVDSPTAMSPGDSVLAEQFEMPDSGDASERVAIKHKNTGAFGLATNGQCLMWFIISLIGLALVIHAVLVYNRWWYIVLAVIIAPTAFVKFFLVSRRWRRGRSWMTALRHTLEEMS